MAIPPQLIKERMMNIQKLIKASSCALIIGAALVTAGTTVAPAVAATVTAGAVVRIALA